MRELIARIEGLSEAQRPDGLRDFQRESAALTRAIGEAMNQVIHLKGMWDRFEEIPTKQQMMYDDTTRLIGTLAKAKGEAHHIASRLKKYR